MIKTLRPIWFDYHVESLHRAAKAEKIAEMKNRFRQVIS
jgi:hypothetical protein